VVSKFIMVNNLLFKFYWIEKTMTKYKYYFKKPRSEIARDILIWLAITGAVFVAATSPYFIYNVMRIFKNRKKYPKKKIYDTFYRLQREGYIEIGKKNHQIYISLTEAGRKKAGRFQIDSLEIKKPKKWDKKWRLVVFDISQLQRIKREAFRGKLKELGFFPLQKSVWVCPYPCQDEIELLREFFGFKTSDIRLITAEKIEDDKFLKEAFKL